jgi:S1-C subfamily serine protease
LAAFTPVGAQTTPSLEGPAAQLQAATVTVRVAHVESQDAATPRETDDSQPATSDASAARVSIYSGVLLPGGLVVTHLDAAVRARFRLTSPGGQRIDAQLAVLDEYSGLALLETKAARLPSIELAEESPKTGAWVLSAAGWGAEAPAVSLGIVGAPERILPGGRFPPLIQCDLQTASTSRGAGVVNQRGQLVGIVVAVENTEGRRGWTYAAPVRHLRRLLRAREERHANETVVVLKRRRPVVGMVLAGAADDAQRVLVERVIQDGPAAEAGLIAGDRIIAADGLNIRSVYEAQRMVLQKQPGDQIAFLIQRGASERTIDVVLGGGLELPSPGPEQNISAWVRPQLNVEVLGDGSFRTQNGRGEVREVFAPALEDELDEPRQRTPEDQIALLQKALDRYRQAIVFLREELTARDEQRREAEQKLQELQNEIDNLDRKLTPTSSKP